MNEVLNFESGLVDVLEHSASNFGVQKALVRFRRDKLRQDELEQGLLSSEFPTKFRRGRR